MKLFKDLYPGWTIKGLKFFRGMEGDGFNATLYKDGKKVVFVIDEGNGGCFNYEDLDPNWGKTLDELVEAVRTTIPDKTDDSGFNERKSFDRDWLVGDMTSKWEFEQKMRRAVKSKLTFVAPGDEDGTFRTLNAPYDERTKAHVLKKFPGATILNEVLV